VSYRYPGAASLALKGVTCSIGSGEVVGLVGPAASGKSTLGRLIKGLIEPTGGLFTAEEDGGDQAKAPAAFRLKTVGWAGAHPEVQIFAPTVRAEVAFGAANQGLSGGELDRRVNWALQVAGLKTNGCLERHPRSLSGGERRRLALASVVAMRCRFYLFDEPTAGLDLNGHRSFIALLRILRDEGCGMVWITHDIQSLPGVVDRLWGLEDGRLALNRSADDIDWSELRRKMEQGISIKN